MGNKFEVVPGTVELMHQLVANLWDVDKEDIEQLFGVEPHVGAEMCLQMSDECWFVLKWGRPVACGGVVREEEGGYPWFLTTNGEKSADVRYKLAAVSKRFIDAILIRYGTLISCVPVQHKKAFRWLKWLGFEVGEQMLCGTAQTPCRRAYRRA